MEFSVSFFNTNHAFYFYQFHPAFVSIQLISLSVHSLQRLFGQEEWREKYFKYMEH